MDAYVRQFSELMSAKKRKKAELNDLQKKIMAAKQRLYAYMVKNNIETYQITTKINGVDENLVFNRERLQPKPKQPRKKKSEIVNDIRSALEIRGIGNADEIAKEIERVRKMKGEARKELITGMVEYD